MNFPQFRGALTAFADHSADLVCDDNRILVQVRDDLIEATVRERNGEVLVTENGHETKGYSWLRDRIAKIPQLADRILAHIPDEPFFIPPTGTVLGQINDVNPSEPPQTVENAREELEKTLENSDLDRSTVLYLTSDAGEGKTTLINHVARLQGERFKNGHSDFLLVPISLAGRAFLSFDDIVIAELVNRFRFPFFYYDAFLELVKMRLIVPAFDGFEEMFVESAPGEAVSALGHLLRGIESRGPVLVAARRAFFEYRNLETQARLFDTIGKENVAFGQIRLDRWNRKQFLQYARRRSISAPERLYGRIRQHFPENHPSLTRAVLVRRLLDIADTNDFGLLLRRISTAPTDYFYEFVNALVDREAREKWIDRSGAPQHALLSVPEHHQLLGQVAMEMWLSASEAVPADSLEIVADLFADSLGKLPAISNQIKERIHHHALLVRAEGPHASYRFDHEDFRQFYFGEAVADLLCRSDQESELSRILVRGPLSRIAADATANSLRRRGTDLSLVTRRLQQTLSLAPPASHVQENAGAIVTRVLELKDDSFQPRLVQFGFPADALRGRQLGAATFADCLFQGTALHEADISKCRFLRCTFVRLEIASSLRANDAVLEDCEVYCVVSEAEPDGIFDPGGVERELKRAGFLIKRGRFAKSGAPVSSDPATKLAESVLRCFLRATQINENVLRQRLGTRAPEFFDRILPKMLDKGALRVIDYHGRGQQRRYGLAVPMAKIAASVPIRASSLDEFLSDLHSAA